MVQNIYKSENYKEIIEGLKLDRIGIEDDLLKAVQGGNVEDIREVLEHMWCQNIRVSRVEVFMNEVMKVGIEVGVKKHIDFWFGFGELGYTPYLI